MLETRKNDSFNCNPLNVLLDQFKTDQTKTHFSQCLPLVWPKQGIPWESWRPEHSENVVVRFLWTLQDRLSTWPETASYSFEMWWWYHDDMMMLIVLNITITCAVTTLLWQREATLMPGRGRYIHYDNLIIHYNT